MKRHSEKYSEKEVRDALSHSIEALKRYHGMTDRDAGKIARESHIKQERMREEREGKK